jgi:hypothetical protein
MSQTVVLAGTNYTIPDTGDQPVWSTGLVPYLVAIAAVVSSSPSFMQQVAVAATPTTVVSGKTYLVNSGSLAITLQLPTPVQNFWFIVKDSGFNAFTNNITIARAASEKIDNVAASFVISNSGACWIFMSNGTDWFSVAASLDIRLKDQADGNTYKLFMNNGNLQWGT